MKALLAFAIALLLAGCNTTPAKVEWFTKTNIDPFTDEVSCTVTQGSIYTGGGMVYTVNNHIYPAVHFDSFGVFVGAISGGNILIPVGDLRIRIDSNEPWILQAANNPKTSLRVDGPVNQTQIDAYTQSLTEDQQQQAKAIFEASMGASANLMLPYTFIGGEDAKKLIDEMSNGSIIRLQRIALGNATSTIGTHDIDQSFVDALAMCQSLIQ